MRQPMEETTRAILHPRQGQQKFQLTRYLPSADLAPFVERYWIVRWDLRGQAPYTQEILPYPCANLVFERRATQVYGVTTRKFTRQLTACGRVFGVKFKPGGFYPFVQTPAAEFADGAVAFARVFGVSPAKLEEELLSGQAGQADHERMIQCVERFLTAHCPPPDPTVAFINEIITHIEGSKEILRVDDLVGRFAASKRTLQRLFHQYVGVSPKWVIQRVRHQEAAERLTRDPDVVDWPRFAAELGYFDQAHFIKDFKALVGETPVCYAARQRAAHINPSAPDGTP